MIRAAEPGVQDVAQLLAFARERQRESGLVDRNAFMAGVVNCRRSLWVPRSSGHSAGACPECCGSRSHADRNDRPHFAINVHDAGGLTLRRSTPLRRDARVKNSVAIPVEDTSSGVREDILPHVLKPLFTLDNDPAVA